MNRQQLIDRLNSKLKGSDWNGTDAHAIEILRECVMGQALCRFYNEHMRTQKEE
jgi:hypothetical protein